MAFREVVRRIIEADNSCLFNAVAYNLERTRCASQRLRRVVKDTIAGDPTAFNDGLLGKSNSDYQEWIMDKDHWGGPIELVVLSRWDPVSKFHAIRVSTHVLFPGAQATDGIIFH